jgi:hypothetical protein
MFDLNVLLDLVQRREPHYRASALALSQVVERATRGVFPCHGVTTLHYLVARHSGRARADELVDWLLRRFVIGPAGDPELRRARQLPLPDFEHAVVCAIAEATACEAIVTRNLGDFAASPVRALSPEEFLFALAQEAGQ